jgi:hypothetical protein
MRDAHLTGPHRSPAVCDADTFCRCERQQETSGSPSNRHGTQTDNTNHSYVWRFAWTRGDLRTFREFAASANELVRKIVANEIKAETEDHSHWAFQLQTEKAGRRELDEVVETKDGNLQRPVCVNGQPLTAKQREQANLHPRCWNGLPSWIRSWRVSF